MNQTQARLEMLRRIEKLLCEHARAMSPYGAQEEQDALALRRIAMTLHRWHELECGDSDAYSSWCITRGNWAKVSDRRAPRQPDGSRWPKEFVHDENGKPYIERHYYTATTGGAGNPATYSVIADREAGALKRLAVIMARYPSLQSYVQGDPRGAALYILRLGDIPAGTSLDSCYSNGMAVFK